MVEKIIINPEEVRAYGNIIEPKEDTDFILYESTLETSTDTIGGETVPVFELQSDFGELTVLTLTTSSATVVLNGTVTLTATLKDEDNAAINGATITFKDGSTTLGTSTTNSSGVATYTYTASSVGSHTLEASFGGDATYASSNANTNVTVLDHSYTLAFDSANYTTSDGNVTAYVTLQDNSVAVSGATVSLSGTGISQTANTNSSGVATFSLTGISQDLTLTASYNSVTATATVTYQSGPTYLFYDDCSSDRTSDYEWLSVNDFNGTPSTWAYDSTNHCYNLGTESVQNKVYGLVPKNISNLTNCKITAKVQVNTTNNVQIGCGLHNNTDTTVQITSRLVKTNNTISIVRIVPDTTIANASQSLSTNTDYIIEFIYDDGDLTFNLYNSSNTLLKTLTGTTTLLGTNNTPMIYFGYQSYQTAKLKEFKVEAL